MVNQTRTGGEPGPANEPGLDGGPGPGAEPSRGAGPGSEDATGPGGGPRGGAGPGDEASASAAPPVLECRSVRKVFRGTPVLDGLNLTVAEHDVVVLIGASGSGKSTLLRCINLLETVDDGEILLDGEEITDPRVNPDKVRQRIGIVFQAFNLFPHLTVLDNITLAPRRVHGRSKAEAEEQAYAWLDRVGLRSHAKEYPDRLSGGQQQRVAIVRALVNNPRLLLLDEVTSALDPQLVGEVLATIRDLRDAGTTMIIATHEMNFARRVADRVCFLDGGTIVEEGPPEQVLGDPVLPRTREFLQQVMSLRDGGPVVG